MIVGAIRTDGHVVGATATDDGGRSAAANDDGPAADDDAGTWIEWCPIYLSGIWKDAQTLVRCSHPLCTWAGGLFSAVESLVEGVF